MILLGLFYHAYLYVFGFPRTRIRMGDAGSFWIPEPLKKVNKRFVHGMRTHTVIEAHRYNRRMTSVWLNPKQMVYWENLFPSERV